MGKTKTKREYVVGYVGEAEAVYGKKTRSGEGVYNWVERMTLRQAKSHLKELSSDVNKTIYKLVPVDSEGIE